VDYLIAGILCLFLPRAAGIALLAGDVLADVFANAAASFYFSADELIASVKYAVQLPLQRILVIGLAVLCSSVGFAMLVSRAAGSPSVRNRRPVAALLCGLLLPLTGMRLFYRLRDIDLHPIAGSPSRHLLIAAWNSRGFSDQRLDQAAVIPSATGPLMAHLNGNSGVSAHGSASLTGMPIEQYNIVLVLVESYGLMRDAEGAAALEAPFHEQAAMDRYEVETGAVAFSGPTVSGEFRELCGVQAGIGSTQIAAAISARCLPALLKDRGYETTAIHGYFGAMFDRWIWYPEIGFQRMEFLEDLRTHPGMHICGPAMPGICDVDIGDWLDQALTSRAIGKPRFIYWLTLNSHWPIAALPEDAALFACDSPHAANPDPSICHWMALIYKVNRAIEKLSTDPRLPLTQFIIVGDHAPPFLTEARRNQFSQAEVPFIRLLPRSPRENSSRSASNARAGNKRQVSSPLAGLRELHNPIKSK
jgi:hypothetical protein